MSRILFRSRAFSTIPTITSSPIHIPIPICIDVANRFYSNSSNHATPSFSTQHSASSVSTPKSRAAHFLIAAVLATGLTFIFRYIAIGDGYNKTTTTTKTPSSTSSSTSSSVSSASSLPSSSSSSLSPSIWSVIGNTPLVELKSLSSLTGRRIVAKLEYLNPGGSIKDRAAKYLLSTVEEERQTKLNDPLYRDSLIQLDAIHPPTIIEATGGNTGVGLALLAPQLGYRCIFTYPESISQEKIDFIRSLGAIAISAPLVPFSSPQHFYHIAEQLAAVTPNSYLTAQFENLANYQAHYQTTGPEIWQQTQGTITGFCCSAGTGGTIGGVSTYLKQQNPQIIIGLIDPPASGLYNYFTSGFWTSRSTSETQEISVVEGIGIFRLTANMKMAQIDKFYAGDEKEAIEMAYHLLQHDGIMCGASAALNVCGAVKMARELPEGSTIVTVLCDGGDKYKSKLFNREWIEAHQMGHVLQRKVVPNLDFVK